MRNTVNVHLDPDEIPSVRRHRAGGHHWIDLGDTTTPAGVGVHLTDAQLVTLAAALLAWLTDSEADAVAEQLDAWADDLADKGTEPVEVSA